MPTAVKPVSPKQIKLIQDLSIERGLDIEIPETSGLASRQIDWLMGQPRAKKTAVTAPSAELKPGCYLAPNDEIVKVKATKDGKRLYAQVMTSKASGHRLTAGGDIVDWEWTYAPSLIRELQPEWRMDASVGEKLSLVTGSCLWCNRKLTDPKSLQIGIGPICRGKAFA